MNLSYKLITTLGGGGFLIVVMASVAVVLPACGALPVFGSLLDDFCMRPAEQKAADPAHILDEQRRELDTEIATLERQLAGLRCAPPSPPPEPEPTIQEAIEQQDTSALQGCWNLDSDYELRDQRTGVMVRVDNWRMCFDTSGSGDQSLAFTDGVACQGGVSAGFGQDTLIIRDNGNVPCTRGIHVVERRLTCRIAGNRSAHCVQSHPSTPNAPTVNVTLRR